MDQLIVLLKLVGCIVALTWIWFNTNALYEYIRWIPFQFIKKYKTFLHTEPETNLIGFLKVYKTGFLIKLITCPVCLMFWVSIFLGFVYDYTFIPSMYTFSLLIYGLLHDKKL